MVLGRELRDPAAREWSSKPQRAMSDSPHIPRPVALRPVMVAMDRRTPDAPQAASPEPGRHLRHGAIALLLVAGLFLAVPLTSAPPVAPTQGTLQGNDASRTTQPGSVEAFDRLVTGQVFVDRDLDGLSDADEVGLAGVAVTLADGQRRQRTRSGPSGRFSFRGDIAPGYVVWMRAPKGYRVTTSDRFQHLPHTAAPAEAIGFGLGPATNLSPIGMTGPGPEDGHGRYPTSSFGKDDPTCAS